MLRQRTMRAARRTRQTGKHVAGEKAGQVTSHPYAVAMEAAMLAPKAGVSMFPWKEPKERIPLAVRQIRSFLRAHRPVST